ncbi:CdaR family transcriptional regulator [Breznakiella homolactica]|uniref:Helix-turn-helix domain-containing protein n=1 Tax=Breznakiella homolactica TaxID=2798577 RepID=A0A7T7XPQ8_9SPIR|nr:sugar diacid recognition domain-containing protein [Breznakiella homolactica]QQO10230.1 helix-turn-helix domain-containing protein [Breznakiella homolactica]
MTISKEIALRIVSDISGIINQHVNMMNDQGIIIASTDAARIGTYHAAAYRIIDEKLQELTIFDDDEYEGTRKGINVPVMLNGDIAGVIGVTGEYSEVSKYSQIIRRMTEILLLESYSAELKNLEDRIRQRFLGDWLSNETVPYEQAFVERGRGMGIDVTIPRRILAAEISGLSAYSDNLKGQRIIDSVNRSVRRITEEISGSVFVRTASSMICLLAGCDDAKLRSVAEKIQDQIQKQYGLSIAAGIDEPSQKLSRALEKAQKALAAARGVPGNIRFYSEINLEIFMDEVSPASKMEFIRHIFGGYTDREMEKPIHLLRVYFDTNGSVSRTAERLCIHKNTLQYHLNKLHERTGLNPRNMADAALYYLAIQFFGDIKKF